MDNLEKYQKGKHKIYQRMIDFHNHFFIIKLREREVSHTQDPFFFSVNYGRFHYAQFDFNCKSSSSGVYLTVVIISNDYILNWDADGRESGRFYTEDIKQP